MAWVVEALDARVRDEIEALPDDMKVFGPERVREPRFMGDAHERPGRHLASRLRGREKSAGGRSEGVHKEDASDTRQ